MEEMKNQDMIALLLAHRSVREFTAQPVTEEMIDTIVACAQQAPTSSYLQAYTIIRVTDADKRAALAVYAGGQEWVRKAPLVLLFLFTCGIALLLSALAVYFRDLQYLYGILTMAWMYATPLFYPLSALPPFMVPIIKLNPLYHYINCMRCLVMYGTLPGPNTWIACIGSAVVMMGVGLAAFRKLQRNFILYL